MWAERLSWIASTVGIVVAIISLRIAVRATRESQRSEAAASRPASQCDVCNGSGRIEILRNNQGGTEAGDDDQHTEEITCPKCEGTGYIE